MAALQGSLRFRGELRFVAFDLPFRAGVDLRPLPWTERRERLELHANAYEPPYQLSPLVQPSRALAEQMAASELGICPEAPLRAVPRRQARCLEQGQGFLVA